MGMRFGLAATLVALATPCFADDAVANIADAITSYRLTAEFCHWPIAPRISQLLDSDERRFTEKDPAAFQAGVKSATDRHDFASSSAGYCNELKSSRDELTVLLEKRIK